MSVLSWGMLCAGVATLVAGLVLVLPRLLAASGPDKLIVLGPVFAAAPLTVFAMEHFLASGALSRMVPRWLPGPLFWTFFVGVALVAAALSFIFWRCVRWSSTLLAVLFLIIVVTMDLPGLAAQIHNRLMWTLTLRETSFAAGALVLAGSLRPNRTGAVLMRVGRLLIGVAFVVYAIEHFLFPHNVPGVPLEKMTPSWIPAPVLISFVVGAVLLVAGVAVLIPRRARVAAAGSGLVLLLLTAFFYVPIFISEFSAPLNVEGLNYIFDTMLFAATALLAGYGAERSTVPETKSEDRTLEFSAPRIGEP